MLKYIVPRFPLADLPAILSFTAIGALIAGCYGILHDQITFTLGPEYFYNFKFQQFDYADWGLGDRIFVGCIGFLATWWVGLFVGWILARRCLPHQDRQLATRQILLGFLIVFSTAIATAAAGYGYGLWRGPNADYSDWQLALTHYKVTDSWAFMRVAYVHNASYLGGLIGLILTYVFIRPQPVQTETSKLV